MPVSLAEINAKNKAFNTYDRKGRRATDAQFQDGPAFYVGQLVEITLGSQNGRMGNITEVGSDYILVRINSRVLSYKKNQVKPV
jgi:hypothetical protein